MEKLKIVEVTVIIDDNHTNIKSELRYAFNEEQIKELKKSLRKIQENTKNRRK